MFEGGYTVSEPLVKNVYLQIIKVGETMSLKNVFFAFDSWELKAESTRELDNLVKLLIQNPTVKIEIGGHTDIIGTEGYNQTLSEKRALAVVDYIISKGIKLERLSYKGYGNSMPIGDNRTEEGRELNRRTEVKILGM